jgi:putative transposase
MAFETLAKVVEHLLEFIDDVYNTRRLRSAVGYISSAQFEKQYAWQTVNLAA